MRARELKAQPLRASARLHTHVSVAAGLERRASRHFWPPVLRKRAPLPYHGPRYP